MQPARSSQGRRPPATPQQKPRVSSNAGMGARLSDDVVLVCAVLPGHEFVVRTERTVIAQDTGTGRPAPPELIAYLPPHIWNAINALPGASLALNKRSWTFPLRKYEAILPLLEQLGNPVEKIPWWALHLARRAESASDSRTLNLERLPAGLLPYQHEGVRFGVSHDGRCLIGDEMGLGKTLQALAIVSQYVDEWPVLVLCPSTLKWVWKEQVEQWIPNLAKGEDIQVISKGTDSLRPTAKFWIMSYNILATDAKTSNGKFQKRPDGTPHRVVVADESHNIKDWGAARTRAVVPLLQQANRAICLSGTPTRNSADELHPQLCGLLPKLKASLRDFRSRYCLEQERKLYSGQVVRNVVGTRNSAELNHLLTSTVMVRRLKKDVITELPAKRRQRVPLEVADAKQMKEIRAELQVLEDAMQNPKSDSSDKAATVFSKLAKAKLPAVKEYLQEVLERGDEKMIIFAHHKVMIDEIDQLVSKHLKKDGLTHIRIDGGTPTTHRQRYVQQFQSEDSCRVAVLSITACGEGLTLTAAGLVIFAELYWVPGAVEQAEARAHRIGTSFNKVVVEFLVVRGSPDERIYDQLERKKGDTSSVLDGAKESFGAKVREQRKRKLESSDDPFQLSKSSAHADTPEGSAKKAAAIETPKKDTVDRAKIEFLLRAAKM
eukprot:gnl/TRDRNA2_/TRDRNA2_130120_c0_seq2.p1 gnl/TRDRNA2_/TRDRNA2_130120_c0~~gnl/TRDRNA2_/TRDRNA2_130120_c0_seq2.p1  ORF type:complete len:678 (+),score=124.59 gnl/TRDRNA2_/TRDRNA2_130120_c0_seq2:46-2034(+)